MAFPQFVLAALSARDALAFGVSLCLLVGQIFALVRVGDRFDLLAVAYPVATVVAFTDRFRLDRNPTTVPEE